MTMWFGLVLRGGCGGGCFWPVSAVAPASFAAAVIKPVPNTPTTVAGDSLQIAFATGPLGATCPPGITLGSAGIGTEADGGPSGGKAQRKMVLTSSCMSNFASVTMV